MIFNEIVLELNFSKKIEDFVWPYGLSKSDKIELIHRAYMTFVEEKSEKTVEVATKVAFERLINEACLLSRRKSDWQYKPYGIIAMLMFLCIYLGANLLF